MKLTLISFLLIFISPLSSKAIVQGRVYIDENKNGVYDPGETPRVGVAVSNGKDVVLSGADGLFKLSKNKDTKFIFISIPSGYRTIGDFYQKVTEDSKLYNFGLIKYSRTEKEAKFIQITDTETYEYGDWINNLKDYSNSNKVGFMVHTGDICYEKGLEFHAKSINTKTMGLPVFYCIGNHDLVKGDYGEQLYESLFGPVYYSFNAGNTHFVVTPMKNGDFKPSYTKKQVYNWLVNELAQVDTSMNLVVFNHDLLTFDDVFIFSGGRGKEINLNDHNLKAWVYGHWHINYKKQHGKNGPISVCSSPPDKGGIDHSPSNFLVYNVAENGEIEIEPRYSYLTKHITINAPLEIVQQNNQSNEVLVSVNTYHTISQTKAVKAQLINEIKEEVTVNLNQNTDWNWSVKVPIGKSQFKGKWQLNVVATYANGDTAKQQTSFAILPNKAPSDKFQLAWLATVKSNIWMAKPIESNGSVFVASIDDFGLETCGITAFDEATGEKLWHYKTKGSVKNTICYANGMVLATDQFGIAYAINAETAKLEWKKELGQSSLGSY